MVSNTSGEETQRETWGKKREYILSLLGYSVGFGSLWRFPYLCNRNGGGAFLLPYFTCIILCAVPLFFLEASLGQFSRRSTLHAWAICPLLSGIGTSQFLTSFISAIPYNLIIGWSIYFFIRSFESVLPWTTCGNSWNTPLCTNRVEKNVTLNYTFPDDDAGSQRLLNSHWRKPNTSLTASEEFWQYKALGVSGGLDDVGPVQTHLVLCTIGAWVFVCLCLMRGVNSLGKVVYVTATLPYLLLTVLLVRSCTMPGAADGLLYFLRPDASKLLSVQVWLEALMQGFYSTGATCGGLIAMSSYNSRSNNVIRDVVLVTIAGEASSIFCGLVVFSTLGFMAHEAKVAISEVVSSGSGLGFIIFPEAIAQLPVPQLWAALFFLMLITLGLDSMFGPVEVCIAGIMEMFPSHLSNKRFFVTLGVCGVSALLSLPYTTKGGIYVFQLLEWYSVSFNILLIGCLECVAINWIYGSARFSKDIELMIGRPTPLVLKWCSRFVTPAILLVALVLSLFMFDPPSYGEYMYPTYAKVIGVLMAVLLSVPIPVKMIYLLIKQEGTLLQRFKAVTISRLPSIESDSYKDEEELKEFVET